MRKLTIALIGALFSLTAFSQDLLQCVNPDVVNSLLFGGRPSQVAITRSLPDALSSYEPPAGFELIGSMNQGVGDASTTAFKTDLEIQAAFDALVASFAQDGWIPEEDGSANTFSLPGRPLSGTVCRDGDRRAISVRDVDGTRYAGISLYSQGQLRACGDDGRPDPMRNIFALQQELPQFSFPDTAQAVNSAGGAGISGSSGGVGTATRITSPDSAASLADHLGNQMTAQGWYRDASWTGNLSSGSTWTRQLDDGTPVWATLEVVDLTNRTYDVQIRMQSAQN